jgi:hypothetical protein
LIQRKMKIIDFIIIIYLIVVYYYVKSFKLHTK